MVALYTKISEVNLYAFIYKLVHDDHSSIVRTNTEIFILICIHSEVMVQLVGLSEPLKHPQMTSQRLNTQLVDHEMGHYFKFTRKKYLNPKEH